MCHSTENLYGYRSTSLIRAADDFYPRDDSSQPVHLANVAYNSVFLGEIAHTDWDMFQSTHADAEMHAAARAVGGSPVYVSDRPGEHNFALLEKLVLPDGSILRATGPGRPTRDVLFNDVNSDQLSALKLWNTNKVTGMLGAFNVQGARWDRATRAFVPCDEPEHVVCEVTPSKGEGHVGHVVAVRLLPDREVIAMCSLYDCHVIALWSRASDRRRGLGGGFAIAM